MTSLCCDHFIQTVSSSYHLTNKHDLWLCIAFLCKNVSMSRMLFCSLGSIAGHFCQLVSSAGCFWSVACWKLFCALPHISPQGLAVINPSFPVPMNLQSLTLLPSCSTVRMVLSTQSVWFAPHMTCCTGVQFESHQSSSRVSCGHCVQLAVGKLQLKYVSDL